MLCACMCIAVIILSGVWYTVIFTFVILNRPDIVYIATGILPINMDCFMYMYLSQTIYLYLK